MLCYIEFDQALNIDLGLLKPTVKINICTLLEQMLPVRICIDELVAVLHCSLPDDEEPETVKL